MAGASSSDSIRHWDEEGCFVFKIIDPNGIGVRNKADVGDNCRITGYSFEINDLVSVDLVRHTGSTGINKNGPYLRLSDGSGWIFEYKDGLKLTKRMHVEQQEIWTMYGDNYPSGIALRKHPNDNSPHSNELVQPMQQVYCDAKIIQDETGVCFYRVQGTKYWIFDRRIDPTTKKTTATMLLPPSKISKGLFAYNSLCGMNIRYEPSTNEESRTTRDIKNGEVCIADTIRQGEGGDGPYIRLTDGSGWLFVSKDYEPMLEECYIEYGQEWRFEVVNSAGIALRKQPMDRQNNHFDDAVYANGVIITCDAKIEGSSDVHFFRVKGTDGWVFDKRGDHEMMKPYYGWDSNDEENSSRSAGKSKESWTIDFVRGVAAGFSDSLHEIDFIEQSRVICFSKQLPEGGEPVRINVYYTTRTVGTCMDHPIQGKTQMLRRNCTTAELVETFGNPRVHTGKGCQRRAKNDHHHVTGSSQTRPIHLDFDDPNDSYHSDYSNDPVEAEEEVQNELELRERLLECEQEISKNLSRRIMLFRAIEEFDDKRRKEEDKMETKRENHMKIVQAEFQAIQEQEERKRRQREEEEEIRQRLERARKRIRRDNDQTLIERSRTSQRWGCPSCNKVFKSQTSLNQHRNAVGHW